MRDSVGKIIKIGDIVTLNVGVKPRKWIGKCAQVAAYGDVRLKLVPCDSTNTINTIVRTEPQFVIVGYHKIIMPVFYDEKFLADTRGLLLNLLSIVLEDAERESVIHRKQIDQILKMYEKKINVLSGGYK